MNIRFLIRYIRYRLRAKTPHGIHSPFVYQLVTDVIRVKPRFYAYDAVEAVRSRMLLSREKISITDLGAGSMSNSSTQRKVSDIAANTVKPARQGQLLFRLVNHFQPSAILELGTSLGITTLYLALANKKSSLITIEGCPETAALAKKNMDMLKVHNIQAITGSFDDHLEPSLKKPGKADFIFIDGNHRKEATLRYFETCKKYIHNNSLIVMDDIHWSQGMEQAWEIIKNDPEVSVTIDLFFMGLVFFRKEQAKQDFVIRM